jgi:ABC-2 type transport system ATP-binding protein
MAKQLLSSNAIEINSLTKNYIDASSKAVLKVLKNIDLSIPKGSCFGLLGPNGAGKSTLINILGGITLKTSGQVAICGHDIITSPRLAKASIGIVPQELSIDPFFSIRETLDHYAGYYGIPRRARRTSEIIEILGLSEKADDFPRSLSGGMKRRLLIAKALVHSPQVLILDEPTAGVDISLREQLWNYVRQLNKQGTTIVLTTHYLDEAEKLCDHIAIINKGTIIANDKTSNLLQTIDHKQLTIKFTHKLTQVPDFLNKFNVRVDDKGNLLVQYPLHHSPINEIIKHIVELGLEVLEITTNEARLDDVFKHLLIQGNHD